MDHTGSETGHSSQRSSFVLDGAKRYRMPYRAVRNVTFSSLKKEDLQDSRHAARLQYRLMLIEPVIKAAVDFSELKISVIYNPNGASNGRPGTDIGTISEFLEKEGVHVHPKSTRDSAYDYYSQLYSYAYSPARIRKSTPYGYSLRAWMEIAPSYEKKTARADKEKLEKFRAWQSRYLKEHPGASGKGSQKRSVLGMFFKK